MMSTILKVHTRVRSGAAVLLAVVCLAGGTAAAFSGSSTRSGGYLVRPGDTLSGIAAHFGVTVGALATTNHITDPNHIFAGEHLVIPTAATVVAAPTGTARFPARLLAHPDRLTLLPSFRHWAPAYGVPTGLLEALAWMESGWQRTVVSKTGAIGVGQLEPSTVRFVCQDLLGLGHLLDPRDGDANIRMSAAYLGGLLATTHGDVSLALAGYYQGLQSVRARGEFLSTQVYIAAIRSLWQLFGAG